MCVERQAALQEPRWARSYGGSETSRASPCYCPRNERESTGGTPVCYCALWGAVTGEWMQVQNISLGLGLVKTRRLTAGGHPPWFCCSRREIDDLVNFWGEKTLDTKGPPTSIF